MIKKQYINYPSTPFRVETESVENKPGTWNSTKISIYRDGNLIGEYLRNYADYSALTFKPFMSGDEWYALYSPHYTATRVLKLHRDRIEDWCGEEPTSNGFCPVEIYVPRYIKSHHTMTIKDAPHEFDSYYVDCDFKTEQEFIRDATEDGNPATVQYTDFGFLCGCVWGDDTSWKIRYIDLKSVPDKVLSITDKFGYWSMPRSLSLKECIDMTSWEPDDQVISLTRAEYINLETGHRFS
jgi:hypothetical protein